MGGSWHALHGIEADLICYSKVTPLASFQYYIYFIPFTICTQPWRASFNLMNGFLPFCSTSTFSDFTFNMLIFTVSNISPLSNICFWYPNPNLNDPQHWNGICELVHSCEQAISNGHALSALIGSKKCREGGSKKVVEQVFEKTFWTKVARRKFLQPAAFGFPQLLKPPPSQPFVSSKKGSNKINQKYLQASK